MSWTGCQGVHLAYSGEAPDVEAFEYADLLFADGSLFSPSDIVIADGCPKTNSGSQVGQAVVEPGAADRQATHNGGNRT